MNYKISRMKVKRHFHAACLCIFAIVYLVKVKALESVRFKLIFQLGKNGIIILYEWHKLLLEWIEKNKKGERKPFLMEGYNWKTYGDMNVVFWQRNQEVSLEEALERYKETHQKVMKQIESMTNDELFQKNVYDWVRGSTLGSYFISNTSSHYDWAMKKIKLHKKSYQ